MKICNHCNARQPDNFMLCSRCGTPISELQSGGIPMRLYIYSREMGKKIGAVGYNAIIPWIIGGIAALFTLPTLFLIIAFAAGTDSKTVSMIFFGIAMGSMTLVIVGLLLLVLNFQKKRMKDNIAYMYYDGALYRLIMLPYRTKRPNPYAGRYAGVGRMSEFRQRSADPNAYIQLFEQYISGVKLWDPMWGGDIYIEPLHKLRITGSTAKYFQYTCVTPNGQISNGIIDNAYPGIEEIFNIAQ